MLTHRGVLKQAVVRSLCLLMAGFLVTVSGVAKESGFTPAASMGTARAFHTATLLPSGKVFVAGGNAYGTSISFSSTELYDPINNTWNVSANLTNARHGHTATLLNNGKVLVVAGYSFAVGAEINSVEIYDPATNTWSTAASVVTARSFHTATVLNNGNVLIVGGKNGSNQLDSGEIYNPATNAWSPAGTLSAARSGHVATLLSNGKILIAGGGGTSGSTLNTSELYDPSTNAWGNISNLTSARISHTATLLPNGKVLVAGGSNGTTALNSNELYDPATNSWSATSNFATTQRQNHFAVLLPSGKVLVGGGIYSTLVLNTSEVYDPNGNTWTASVNLVTGRHLPSATVLSNGKTFVVGGLSPNQNANSIASAEIYDSSDNGNWSQTGSLSVAHHDHDAVLLSNGKVLVVGGANSSPLKTCELYDPSNSNWSPAGSLSVARLTFASVLLPNGKVLAIGGGTPQASLGTVELYNPSSNSWSNAASLNTARLYHSASLLGNGKVLVVGGEDGFGTAQSSVELYDLTMDTWSPAGSLITARRTHTATVLTNGKVLVAGGYNGNNGSILSSAEIYDPANNSWSQAGNMAHIRNAHTATLLNNGKVLVTGGYDGTSPLNSAEIYDPLTNSWNAVSNMSFARYDQTATLLRNGTVLVAGGENVSGNAMSSTEVYDPVSNTWKTSANLKDARQQFTAVLLTNGTVLVAGGYNSGQGGSPQVSSAELYDSGLGVLAASQPVITTATSPLTSGAALVLTGTGFKGLSEASGGSTNNSPTNYPLVQLRSLTNEQTRFLTPDPNTPFTATTYASTPVSGFPTGFATVTVYVNGVPSEAKIILVNATQSSLAATKTTIGAIAPTTGTVGQSVTIPFTVTSLVQGTITGNVIVGDGTTSVTVPVATQSATLAFSTAGTHVITAAYQGDATFAGSLDSKNYSVDKATATVTLGNLNQVFDGTPKAVTVTTAPPNLAVTVTYNGSLTVPSAIGSYTVMASINDSNYTGNATGTLVISGTKLNATITISNQAQTYDGTAKSVTVTTVPVGLSVAITYNGATTAPTNAGSYPVTVTVNDAVYMGTLDDTLVIAQAATTVSVSNAGLAPSFIYADIQDQPVLFVASIKSGNLTINDGTVVFTVLQGQTVVGVATTPVVVANGQAQATYTLPQFTLYGNYTIKADFSASANFATNSNSGGILVVSNVLNPEQPVITNQRIIFSRVPARTATAVTLTASAFAVSGFPLQTFKWTYYNIDTNTLDGPVVLHRVNGATTDSDTHTFQKDGSYRVYLVVSDGVSSASIGNDINAVQVGKDGTVSLAPNGVSTDSNLLITDKTGSDLSTVMNPINNLGIKLPESVGGVINFDAHLNGTPILPSDSPGKQKYSLFSTNATGVAGLDPSYAPISATAVRFGTRGVYSVELRDTSTPTLRVARIMVPVSDPETGASIGLTDKRSTTRPLAFAFKGNLSAAKTNTITGSVQLELDAGLDLSKITQMSMGVSNIITDATFNSKGKATWSDPIFSKVSMIMPKLARGSTITQQGALMTINYTITAKTPDQIAKLHDAISTEGAVRGAGGVARALALQFVAVINGRTYAGRLPSTFLGTSDFGTINGRSTK